MNLSVPSGILELPVPWEVVAPIRMGRERSVYRVRHAMTGGSAALKIVHGAASAETKRAIEEEFLLLARVRHPHLVRVFRFVHLADGSCGYIMEDLGSDDAKGPESPGWMPRDPEAARSILGALHCLHSIGYAHLDLKPSQVLRAPRGAVLVDLGLAAPIGSPLPARGTWGFIAPELLSGAVWDRRVDIYELGCLLVNVWTGETPLGGGEIAEQIRRQLKRPRLRLKERVAGFPDGLDRVVESFLDPDPAQRPPTAVRAWESLHMMAGARERYLERRRLPSPDEIPQIVPTGIETAWDEALGAREDRPWVIEGPPGSGRHRLMERLAARAEVLGAQCEKREEALHVEFPAAVGMRAGRTNCRIGRARPGERIISLGAVGETQARAALEAYGLPEEGREAEWTLRLLQARLEERLGGEEARRKGSRLRRSLAAAQGAGIATGDRSRLAEALAAATAEEAPLAVPGDRLAAGGWLQVGGEGRLRPSIPPWDRESLVALVEDVELEGAHRVLLGRGGTDPVARARHALGVHDAGAVVASIPAGVDWMREKGDLAGAMALLSEARERLGPAFPSDWLALHASLALEDGTPARCLPLLQIREPNLAQKWRTLIEAHLHNRAGRRREAIDAASPLMVGNAPASVRRAAGAIVLKAMTALGDADTVLTIVGSLLTDVETDVPAAQQLRLAHLVYSYLSTRGRTGDAYERARAICQKCLVGAGARERLVAADVLGGEAFRQGELQKARRYFETAQIAAMELGDLHELAGTQVNLGGIYFEEGRLAESEGLNRVSIESYEQLRMPQHAALARRNLAAVLLYCGRLGEALDMCRAARQELDSLQARADADSAVGLEVSVLCESGLFEAAEAVSRETFTRLRALPQGILEAILLRDCGKIARARGKIDDARKRWSQSVDSARQTGAKDEEWRTLLQWANAEVTVGAIHHAESLVAKLGDELDPDSGSEDAIRVSFYRASMAQWTEGAGAWIGVREFLSGAVGLSARCGFGLWTWRCHAALAGAATKAGDSATALTATRAAREALRDLLGAIGTPALQESFVMSPDPRLFLAWCERDSAVIAELPKGRSDLEVFLQ